MYLHKFDLSLSLEGKMAPRVEDPPGDLALGLNVPPDIPP